MTRLVLALAVAVAVAVACGSQPEPVRPPPAASGSSATAPITSTTPPPPVPGDASVGTAAPPPASPIELPVALDPALGKRLDVVIDKAIAEEQLVAAVVMVARDGKLVYARAHGFADREAKLPVREDTQFRIASMTKPIVSVAALALIDQGKLSLDDPVTKYLPEFRPKLPTGKQPVITVRHLLTHTSGLSYRFIEKPDSPYHTAKVSDGLGEPGVSATDNLKRLASVPLLFEPGTAWHYGLSVDVLGEVVAKAGGASLPEVLKSVVLRPLGMHDTMFSVTDRKRLAWPYTEGKPPVRMTEPTEMKMNGLTVTFSPARIFDSGSFPSGGAGLASTARDYLVFLEALRRGGAPVLEPETTRAMTENQIGEIKVGLGPGQRFGFGVGVIVDPAAKKTPRGKGTFGWGGIYGTGFWVDPVAKLSVVMLTNVAGDTPFDRQVEAAIYSRN